MATEPTEQGIQVSDVQAFLQDILDNHDTNIHTLASEIGIDYAALFRFMQNGLDTRNGRGLRMHNYHRIVTHLYALKPKKLKVKRSANRTWSDEDIERVRILYKTETAQYIAELFNVTENVIRNVLHNNGIKKS